MSILPPDHWIVIVQTVWLHSSIIKLDDGSGDTYWSRAVKWLSNALERNNIIYQSKWSVFYFCKPRQSSPGSIAFAARVQTSADVCSIPAGDWFLLICISWPRLITGNHFDLGRILFKCYRNKERNVLVSTPHRILIIIPSPSVCFTKALPVVPKDSSGTAKNRNSTTVAT